MQPVSGNTEEESQALDLCCVWFQAVDSKGLKRCGSSSPHNLLQIYAVSHKAKDVRVVVQQLNAARGSQREQVSGATIRKLNFAII
jgi:hypothetical protein